MILLNPQQDLVIAFDLQQEVGGASELTGGFGVFGQSLRSPELFEPAEGLPKPQSSPDLSEPNDQGADSFEPTDPATDHTKSPDSTAHSTESSSPLAY